VCSGVTTAFEDTGPSKALSTPCVSVRSVYCSKLEACAEGGARLQAAAAQPSSVFQRHVGLIRKDERSLQVRQIERWSSCRSRTKLWGTGAKQDSQHI